MYVGQSYIPLIDCVYTLLDICSEDDRDDRVRIVGMIGSGLYLLVRASQITVRSLRPDKWARLEPGIV